MKNDIFDKDIQQLKKVLNDSRDQLEELEEKEKDLINLIRDSEGELEDVRNKLVDVRGRVDGINSLINDYKSFTTKWNSLVKKYPDINYEPETKTEEETHSNSVINYMEIIRQAYYNNKIVLASSKGKMFGKDSKKYDGLIYDKYLYLKGECIDRIIQEKYPNTKHNDWVHYLFKMKLLRTVSPKSKTVQIPGCNTINFYALYLSSLSRTEG